MLFFKNHAENKRGKLAPHLFCFLKKTLCEVKQSGLQLNFKIYRWPSAWHTLKSNCMRP